MASYESFLGSVDEFAGNFAPKGWAFCAGQIIDIANHTALFSILGTTYGGDGIRTFALPDLRPIENGQKVDWWALERPIPAKIIHLEGVFPSRG